MAAEGGAAALLDSRHDLQLTEAQVAPLMLDALVDPSRQRSLMHGAVELSGGQGLDRGQAWEEPPAIEHLALGTGDAPPGAQPLEHHRGEHGVAVLAALALLDAQGHARAIDVPDLQRDD